MLILIREKYWEGCQGLVVTDRMRVTIAAQAGWMCLGMPSLPFERLLSILIYPDTFVAPQTRRQPWGLEVQTTEPRLGEAWHHGPLVLSWHEVETQCHHPALGRNVVIHEFAHLLDMANGETDGIPLLPTGVDIAAWVDGFQSEFERHQRAIRHHRATPLDDYAATQPAEFFAVASEVYFMAPDQLREGRPPLYALLRQFYQQLPATGELPGVS